jgi:N-acetylated-alpha-linked acidic dipeptidase
LDNATAQRKESAMRFEKAYAPAVATAGPGTTQINDLLRQTDQVLLLDGGLPKRPWYEHSLYAPGLYTGYGVKTMPGVREAIEQKSWKEADVEIGRVAEALLREADLINRAALLLERRGAAMP